MRCDGCVAARPSSSDASTGDEALAGRGSPARMPHCVLSPLAHRTVPLPSAYDGGGHGGFPFDMVARMADEMRWRLQICRSFVRRPPTLSHRWEIRPPLRGAFGRGGRLRISRCAAAQLGRAMLLLELHCIAANLGLHTAIPSISIAYCLLRSVYLYPHISVRGVLSSCTSAGYGLRVAVCGLRFTPSVHLSRYGPWPWPCARASVAVEWGRTTTLRVHPSRSRTLPVARTPQSRCVSRISPRSRSLCILVRMGWHASGAAEKRRRTHTPPSRVLHRCLNPRFVDLARHGEDDAGGPRRDPRVVTRGRGRASRRRVVGRASVDACAAGRVRLVALPPSVLLILMSQRGCDRCAAGDQGVAVCAVSVRYCDRDRLAGTCALEGGVTGRSASVSVSVLRRLRWLVAR